MRIVHVITGLGTGGAEQVLLQLLEASDRDRYEPVVVSLMDDGVLGERIRRLDVPLETLGMRAGSLNPFSLVRLRRLLSKYRPDIVQGWMYHGNVAASLAAYGKFPVVWGIHHSLHDLPREKWLTRLMIRAGCWLSSATSRIVYCSAKSAGQHEAIGYDRSRTVVIPNGFNTDIYQPSTEAGAKLVEQLGLSEGALIIGHAARYHPMKNHIGLLEAFAAVASDYPCAVLVPAGPGVGQENNELMQCIQETGLGDRVRLLGERRDMATVMPAFDLYVSVSAWGEAFPMVLGEAMACGVPCLATDIGDSALLIGDTGRVVHGSDRDTLAAGLGMMLEMTPEERRALGERARQRIRDHFSLASMAQQYAAVYDSVLRQ